MIERLRAALKGRARFFAAMGVAGASDALSFGAQLIPPLQLAVDIATALLLWMALGFRWPLFLALAMEALPVTSSFPSWVVAVGALMAMGPSPRPEAAMDAKKILSRAELGAEFARLRAAGKKAVFTNGVFDLLHVGHMRYLKQARGLGDALCVGLNSDASVRRLKGAERPILPEAERAELLAALACVDYVCVFDEDDPRELIKAATPALLVKGGDWPVEKILGRDTVEAAGGKVLSLPYIEGRSTTGIVKSILERYKGGFSE